MSRKGRSPYDGLPITVSSGTAIANEDAARRTALQRRGSVGINFKALTQAPGDEAPPGSKRAKEDELRRASYLVGDTTPSKADLTKADLPGFMRLEVNEIQKYEGNPRLFMNEKREEIKAALKAHGLHDAFVVTRRGVGQPYILAAGSNTTLELMQELYQETGEERFRYAACVYQDYVDEKRLLAQHIGENVNRGDMRFYEVARAMLDLAGQLEKEQIDAGLRTKRFSVREIAEALAGMGLKVEKSYVSVWQFAVERLGSLGELTAHLRPRDTLQVLQPRLNQLRNLAGLHGISEQQYWSEVVEPALRRAAQQLTSAGDVTVLDVSVLIDAVISALGDRISETSGSIREMLAGLSRNPSASLADLRAPSPNLAVGPSPVPLASLGHEDPLQPGTGQQAPLALPPTGVPAPSTAPVPATTTVTTTRQRNAGSPPAAPVPPPQQAHLGLAGDTASAAPDEAALAPLEGLLVALQDLLDYTGMGETLVRCPTMPLGFLMELPDPERHKRVMVAMDSPEDHMRQVKNTIWWTLSRLSGQWANAVPEFIDQSTRFYRLFSTDPNTDPFAGLDIEQEPDHLEALLVRVKPGAHTKAMDKLRTAEAWAGQVFLAHPERWHLMERLQASNSPY